MTDCCVQARARLRSGENTEMGREMAARRRAGRKAGSTPTAPKPQG